MDRTQNAVQRMLAALDAPAYDLGVLSERGMLPGLANLSASGVLARIPLLKAHNARGAHIYIRPAGEHRYTVLDDLSAEAVERLSVDGYEPCAVIETSPSNFQAWLKHGESTRRRSPHSWRRRSPSVIAPTQRGGLAPLWPTAGIHQPEAQVPEGKRTLPLRSFTFKLRGGVLRCGAIPP